jgi:hypothetical protein
VHQDPPDDILILAERLRLGIPLHGMDGRDIPVCDGAGRSYAPIEAALMLLRSALTGMSDDEADAYLDEAVERAILVEDAAVAAGIHGGELDARITGVLVSAAVRADVMSRNGTASPSELNRATLAWYELNHLRRASLLSPRTIQRHGGRPTWGPDASRLMA